MGADSSPEKVGLTGVAKAAVPTKNLDFLAQAAAVPTRNMDFSAQAAPKSPLLLKEIAPKDQARVLSMEMAPPRKFDATSSTDGQAQRHSVPDCADYTRVPVHTRVVSTAVTVDTDANSSEGNRDMKADMKAAFPLKTQMTSFGEEGSGTIMAGPSAPTPVKPAPTAAEKRKPEVQGGRDDSSNGSGFDSDSESSDHEKHEGGEGEKRGQPTEPKQRNRRAPTREDLENNFHLTLRDAAKEMDICTTTLKKACRRYGIKRWPRRRRIREGPVTTPALGFPSQGGVGQPGSLLPTRGMQLSWPGMPDPSHFMSMMAARQMASMMPPMHPTGGSGGPHPYWLPSSAGLDAASVGPMGRAGGPGGFVGVPSPGPLPATPAPSAAGPASGSGHPNPLNRRGAPFLPNPAAVSTDPNAWASMAANPQAFLMHMMMAGGQPGGMHGAPGQSYAPNPFMTAGNSPSPQGTSGHPDPRWPMGLAPQHAGAAFPNHMFQPSQGAPSPAGPSPYGFPLSMTEMMMAAAASQYRSGQHHAGQPNAVPAASEPSRTADRPNAAPAPNYFPMQTPGSGQGSFGPSGMPFYFPGNPR